jgi:hypothetical protein
MGVLLPGRGCSRCWWFWCTAAAAAHLSHSSMTTRPWGQDPGVLPGCGCSRVLVLLGVRRQCTCGTVRACSSEYLLEWVAAGVLVTSVWLHQYNVVNRQR